MTRMGKWKRKERIPSAEGDYELEHRMNAISRSTAQLSQGNTSSQKGSSLNNTTPTMEKDCAPQQRRGAE